MLLPVIPTLRQWVRVGFAGISRSARRLRIARGPSRQKEQQEYEIATHRPDFVLTVNANKTHY
jgi:hypothetical protein